MKNIKVLMLSKSPLYNDSRVIKEANYLYNAGYKIIVLFCSGYILNRKFKFKIKSIKSYGNNSSIFKKIIFSIFNIFIIIYLGAKIKPDVTHCHDLNTLLEGVIISIFSRSKIVYDSHELFYYTCTRRKLNRFLEILRNLILKIYKIQERILSRKVDAIITVCSSIASEIKFNIKKEKMFYVIMNCTEKNGLNNYKGHNIFYEMFPELKGKYIAITQGNITEFKFDEVVIDVINDLDNIALVILGEISKGYKNKLIEKSNPNNRKNKVYFINAVDRSLLYDYTSSADIGLVLIKNVCLSYYYSLPNRLFEYISCGIPILASNMLEISRIVKRYNLGEIYEYGSKESLLKHLNNIILKNNYKKYSINSKKAFNVLNWENEGKKLLNLYKVIVD